MKAIPGFPSYYATEDGRIWSVPRATTKGGFLKSSVNENGYLKVSLSQGGKTYYRKVHILVARAFLGPRPDGLDVRHLDGNQTNNGVRNLQYGTRSRNNLDAVSHGTHAMASKTHCKQGHEFTLENIFVWAARPNARVCRQCKARWDRAGRARAARKAKL